MNEPPKTVFPDPRIVRVKLWAWIGEDENGSGEWGIKQAIVPAGCIPIVATQKARVEQRFIQEQLAEQVARHGKTISLVRFTFDDVEQELKRFK